MKVVILLNLSDERYDQMKLLLDDKKFVKHPALFSVDYGESLLISDQNLYGIRRLYELVKSKAPQVNMTLSGWRADPADIRNIGVTRVQDAAELVRILDYLDYISVQAYNIERLVEKGDAAMSTAFNQLLEPLVKVSKGKPIVFSEFGVPTATVANDFKKTGTLDAAADAYTLFLRIARKLPFDWNVRAAWAYILIEDDSNAAHGWGLFINKGDKLTPAARAMRAGLQVDPGQ